MNIGLLFPFRNAPRWHRPFPQYYAEQLAQVRLAEQLGYDTVWLSEHHFSEDGYSPSLLPIAASIATMTTRIRIGTNLIILPLHNALRVAEDAATVDVLSNGRFDLGVGRGYSKQEFAGYGVSREERGSRLTEGLEVIEGLWSQECFSYTGKHYRIRDARLAPKPVQQPRPPIWVGSHGPKTMDMMARRGYHYLGTGEPATQAAFDAALKNNGRRIDDHHAAHLCWTHVAPTYEQAWDNVQEHFHYMFSSYAGWLAEAGDLSADQRPAQIPPAAELRHAMGDELGLLVVGSPDQVAEKLDVLRRRTRTTHLVLGMHIAGLHPDRSRESMELFASRVKPLLR
jgi:alkanesulfonate monooxygenase SsuD/methylene tetrahydromethanopterin reductase-like flavin-dependent oxidoreductase (luciferase family)